MSCRARPSAKQAVDAATIAGMTDGMGDESENAPVVMRLARHVSGESIMKMPCRLLAAAALAAGAAALAAPADAAVTAAYTPGSGYQHVSFNPGPGYYAYTREPSYYAPESGYRSGGYGGYSGRVRARGDRWDPWGHWGAYYGPMIGF
jgi:hypothetical protein